MMLCLMWATARGAGDPLASSPERWTREDAAHLLRRAGFGGAPEDIDALFALGREGAVAHLVDYDRIIVSFEPPSILPVRPPTMFKESELTPEQHQELVRFRRQNNIIQFANISEWWLRRMVTTPRPLEEKLVLFWHGLLTSGMREVESPRMMYAQNELFRRYAKSHYTDLIRRICYDPAMLRYLDNVSNVASHPNENFARELLELFTLGPGNYRESDIQSVARAFTGWTVNRSTGMAYFDARNHDYGFKPLLGQVRRFNGIETLDVILAQPAASRHLARKLWVFFAGSEPDEELLKALADVLRRSNYDVSALLRRMFLSDAFYDPSLRFQAVKSPVELVVGTYRTLGIQPLNAAVCVQSLRRMGQELFQPPNVKGWDGGLKWINTSTLLERYNFATSPLYGAEARRGELTMSMTMTLPGLMPARRDLNLDQPPFDPGPIMERFNLRSPEDIVDHFAMRLLYRPLHGDARQALIDFLRTRNLHAKGTAKEDVNQAIRGLIHLIISTPEYQVH